MFNPLISVLREVAYLLEAILAAHRLNQPVVEFYVYVVKDSQLLQFQWSSDIREILGVEKDSPRRWEVDQMQELQVLAGLEQE
jgi:hypothetical protein